MDLIQPHSRKLLLGLLEWNVTVWKIIVQIGEFLFDGVQVKPLYSQLTSVVAVVKYKKNK